MPHRLGVPLLLGAACAGHLGAAGGHLAPAGLGRQLGGWELGPQVLGASVSPLSSGNRVDWHPRVGLRVVRRVV